MPSGLKWAKCNLGASLPGDVGNYYSWANIDGHSINSGFDFSPTAYTNSPGHDIITDIPLSHDAANVAKGGSWRIPKTTEFAELIANCSAVYVEFGGINGLMFTSNNNGKTLFMPATGFFRGEDLVSHGVAGYYWSSTHLDENASDRLTFNDIQAPAIGSSPRRLGLAIRPVFEP